MPHRIWLRRCHLLEADDVRGAVRRYGGHVRPLGPQFCDIAPPPPAPTELAATVDPGTRVVHLTWRNPVFKYLTEARYTVTEGACPTDPKPGKNAYPVAAKPGKLSHATDQGYAGGSATGPLCFAVWSSNAFNRPSTHPATVTVQPPPPGAPETPPPAPHPGSGTPPANEPPTADFGYDYSAADPGPYSVSFVDHSEDYDGHIAAWAWDFGDRESSTAQSPNHVYSGPGSYTVTLTVTDDAGGTDTVSHVVDVSA